MENEVTKRTKQVLMDDCDAWAMLVPDDVIATRVYTGGRSFYFATFFLKGGGEVMLDYKTKEAAVAACTRIMLLKDV